MGKSSIRDKLREWIGSISWRVFLWSIKMTEEEYFKNVVINEIGGVE